MMMNSIIYNPQTMQVILKNHNQDDNPHGFGRVVSKVCVTETGHSPHFLAWQNRKRLNVENGRLFRAANLVLFGMVDLVADGENQMHIADVYSESDPTTVYTVTQHKRSIPDYIEGVYHEVMVKDCDCQDLHAPRLNGSKLCKHVLAVWLYMQWEIATNPEAAAAAAKAQAEAAAETAAAEEIKQRKEQQQQKAQQMADKRQKEYSAWRNSSYGAAAYIRKARANGAKTIRQDIWERAHGQQPDATGQHLPPAEAELEQMISDLYPN